MLKNGEIAEVVIDWDGTGMEVLRHLSRANGSKLRKQVELSEGSWGSGRASGSARAIARELQDASSKVQAADLPGFGR